MPLVRLRNRATGMTAWFANVHNPASTAGHRGSAKWRAKAIAEEARLVRRLHDTGLPVFLTGDMNEREQAFCPLTSRAPLQAARGGSHTGGSCRAGNPRYVDWAFGSPDLTFSGYVEDRGRLNRRTSDHPMIVTHATIAAPEQGPRRPGASGCDSPADPAPLVAIPLTRRLWLRVPRPGVFGCDVPPTRRLWLRRSWSRPPESPVGGFRGPGSTGVSREVGGRSPRPSTRASGHNASAPATTRSLRPSSSPSPSSTVSQPSSASKPRGGPPPACARRQPESAGHRASVTKLAVAAGKWPGGGLWERRDQCGGHATRSRARPSDGRGLLEPGRRCDVCAAEDHQGRGHQPAVVGAVRGSALIVSRTWSNLPRCREAASVHPPIRAAGATVAEASTHLRIRRVCRVRRTRPGWLCLRPGWVTEARVGVNGGPGSG